MRLRASPPTRTIKQDSERSASFEQSARLDTHFGVANELEKLVASHVPTVRGEHGEVIEDRQTARHLQLAPRWTGFASVTETGASPLPNAMLLKTSA